MLAFIKGKVVFMSSDDIVIENNGMGYRVKFNNNGNINLNEEITMYTYMHVREDEISLFGFLSLDEYDLFLKLISVKGLGPKTASNILSFGGVNRIIQAIENNDLAFIKSLPGIGNKTASQIILDLKGKLVSEDNNSVKNSPNIKDAMEALKALGYKQSEISFLTKIFNENKDLSVDEYIKLGLKTLAKKRG